VLQENRQAFDADVIIVGAGPIGLATAIALRHHGVTCVILEQRTENKKYSRANNLWARPQELLASIGLREPLAKKAYGIRQINFFVNGTPAAPTQIDDVESPYPQVLYSGQDVIEETMIAELEMRGGTIARGHRVVGVAQDEDGVTVTFTRDDGGSEEQMRSRYLVAADGAKSTIRPIVGLDFEPTKLPDRMNRQGDVKLSWRRSLEPDQLWFFYYENGFCGVMPVWGGYHRLFFLADDAGVPNRDPTLEELQEIAREVTGDETLTMTEPQWLTHSHFQHGHSPSYAAGRVLLAGDAGHLSLPIGGQGMNSGFHDAVEVAWRLAMTLRGQASPLVLESYAKERSGEHARLDGQQAKGFQRTAYRGPITDAVIGLAIKVYPGIGSLMQGTEDLHQLKVSYPDSPLSEDHVTGLFHRGGAEAGQRAPEAKVQCCGTMTSLFEHIYNPDGDTIGWSLLCFDGRKSDTVTKLQTAIASVASFKFVHPRLVLAGPTLLDTDVPVLSDMDGNAHQAYGLEGYPALVLVRPDGHIAFRDTADRTDHLVAYCRKVFGERPEQ